MTQTVSRLYGSYQHAAGAVNALKSGGFTDDQIGLIAHPDPEAPPDAPIGYAECAAVEGAGVGAGVGGVLGAGAGILTGIGVMAVPGVGPVVAAGWLAALAAGAAAGALGGGVAGSIVGSQVEHEVPAPAGGLVGAQIDGGIQEAEANLYAEGVRRGGSLVTVRVPDGLASGAIQVLDSFGPLDAEALRREYATEGWQRFDAGAPVYVRPRPLQDR